MTPSQGSVKLASVKMGLPMSSMPSIVRFHVHTVPFYPAYFVFRAFRHSETLSTAAGLLATAIYSGTYLTTFQTSSW